MNKFIRVFITIILCMFIAMFFKVHTFAAQKFPFVSSGDLDYYNHPIPADRPGEQLVDPDDFPKVWDPIHGDPFIATNRFMFAEGGKWDYYDQNGVVHYLSNTTNPGVSFSYTTDINASDYGLSEFTGYTLVPDSAFGAKNEKQTAYISGGRLKFHGDLGLVQPEDVERAQGVPIIPGDSSGWSYLLEEANGNPNYWANNWDFWNSGWNADTNVVTVTFTNNHTIAHIKRHNQFGSTGYVNWPLFNNYSSSGPAGIPDPLHQEWMGRFNTLPDSTTVSSSIADAGVQHRYYGIGEKVYLYGTPGVPVVVPGGNNVELYLSIEDPDGIDSDDWVRTPTLEDTFKSGYGIPLVAEVRGFNYISHSTGRGNQTHYSNFEITKGSSKVYVNSTNLDSKILQPSDLKDFNYIESVTKGADEYARYFLKPNINSPLGLRKLYSSVNQQDGSYTLTVKADIFATWTEWRYETHEDTGYPNYTPIWDWFGYGQTGEYINSKTITINIKGSMFDDDSQVIIQ